MQSLKAIFNKHFSELMVGFLAMAWGISQLADLAVAKLSGVAA